MSTLSVVSSSDLRLGDVIVSIDHPELGTDFTGRVVGMNLYDEAWSEYTFRNSMFITLADGQQFSVDYATDGDLQHETQITVAR